MMVDAPRSARAGERPAPRAFVPEICGRRVEPAPDARAAMGAAAASPRRRTCQADGPSSAWTGSTRQPPHERRYSRPVLVDGVACTGLGPSHEPFLGRVARPGPGRPPDQASIVAWTTSFGRRNEVTGQFLRVVTDERPPQRRGGGQRGRRFRGARERVVAVAHPDPDGEPDARPRPAAAGSHTCRGRGRRWSCRSSPPPAGALPPGPLRSSSFSAQMWFWRGSVLPARMSVTGMPLCGETAAFALRRRAPARPPAVGAADLEDHPRGTRTPPFADRAVGRRQVERSDLDGPERAGQAGLQEGLVPAGEADAHLLGGRRRPVVADPLERPDRRDVQRVLERLADEDRAALQLVRVARGPVLARSNRRDVEQEAARASARLASNAAAYRIGLTPSRAGGRRRRRRRTWARTWRSRGRRARSRRCRHRPGRRRCGSRGPRARRCAGPCRAGPDPARSPAGILEMVEHGVAPSCATCSARWPPRRATSRRAAGPASRAS